jgi:WD40 repeat protein/energy-coupling factor transporter ATP-binding protein EcfA2
MHLQSFVNSGESKAMIWSLNRTNFDRNIAVVIGINDYKNGIHPLKTAVNDARAIADLLEKEYQYQEVIRLFPPHSEATWAEINKLLVETLPNKKLTEGDRLLFYFAGHGIARNSEDGPAGYLVPQDAQLGKLERFLPMRDLNSALSQLECHHLLVILDCCFAGNFRWSSSRNVISVPETIHREHYDRFIRHPAWQAITSAAHNQEAIDFLSDLRDSANNSPHSPFANALIEGLKEIKADLTKDGVIIAPELYLYLRDNLIDKDGLSELQTAGLWPLQKHDRGEFIFTLPDFVPEKLKPAPPLDVLKNPYRGLEPYEEEDSKLFFGRTEQVKKLQNFVKTHALTVVLGASGSGKSSLVKAGLIPQLRQDQTEKWLIIPPIRPGETPLQALNNALKEAQFSEIQPQQPEKNLAWSIEVWTKNNPNSKLLLFIDQSEEIITLCSNEDVRKEFFQQVLTAIDSHRDKLRVVLSLRSDFEPQVRDTGLKFIPKGYSVKNTELKNRWQSGRFIVSPMTRGELREAIQKPAETRVMFFEPPELVEKLIDEVADMPGALPLLSFALSELYLKYLKRQQDAGIEGKIIERAMTLADYEGLGGVTQSLTQRANKEYDTLVEENEAYAQIICHVMLRMIAIGGGELTRRRVPLSELEYPPEKNDFVKKVIECFTEARLLVQGQNAEENPYVEPAHDALVRGWQKLREWKQEEEENLILQQRLTVAANDWRNKSEQEKEHKTLLNILRQAETLLICKVENWQLERESRKQRKAQSSKNFSEKSIQYLWDDDPRLEQLKRILIDNNWFNRTEDNFIRESLIEQRRNAYRLIGIVTAVGLGLVGLTITALYSAQVSSLREKAARAQNLLSSNSPMEGLILAIQATGESQDRLRQVLPEIQTVLPNAIDTVRERNILRGHNGWVISVAVSRDGKYIATGSEDSTVQLWSIEGELIHTFKGHQDWVNSVAFSSDGKYILSGSADKTVKLWSKEGQLLKTLPLKDRVNSVSFSPSSDRIITGSSDGTIQLWSTKGQLLKTFRGHQGSVRSIAFSSDGKYIVSGGIEDSTVWLWTVEGKLIKTFTGQKFGVMSVTFSPNGQYIISGGRDRTLRLWSVEDGLLATKEHEAGVTSVSFSQDGEYIVSSSFDNSSRLWTIVDGSDLVELAAFRGHEGEVYSTTITPDNKLLISGGRDGTIRLWSTHGQPSQLLKKTEDGAGIVTSVAFSPDGKYIAGGNKNYTIRIWTIQGDEIAILKGHQDEVKSVIFSPNGEYIISGSSDNTIRFWSLKGELLKTLKQPNKILSVAISPDGKYIASGSADNTIRLWSIEGSEIKLLSTFDEHENAVNSVVFSPNSKYIVSGSEDSTVRLWSVEGQLLKTMKEHEQSVYSVAFSPDGQYIASSGIDSTVRLWSLEGEQVDTLRGHQGWVYSVAFSPDGQYIVSGGRDNTVRLWSFNANPINNSQVLSVFRGHFGEVQSVAFSPDSQYIASGGQANELRLWGQTDWRSWLQVACNNLKAHPIFQESAKSTKGTRNAKNICTRAAW